MGGSCHQQVSQTCPWQSAPGAPCLASGILARRRRVEAGPSRAKRQSGRQGRGPCQSHHPASGRRGARLGRGLDAGGLGSGRERAFDHQPWRMLSWSSSRGSERGSHLPKVTQQGDVGGLAFQAYPSASKIAAPSTAEGGGTHQAEVPTPKTTPASRGDPGWSCRIPERPSPHGLTRDPPATALPGRLGSQPEPLRSRVEPGA